MGAFGEVARQIFSFGVSPLPIIPGEKRPVFSAWSKYCTELPTSEELDQWVKRYESCNVGIGLGIPLGPDRNRLLAVDVDDDELTEQVFFALGQPPLSKKGKKGITYLLLGPESVANTKWRRLDERGRPLSRPSVELLARGSQTVIPPSIHPEGMPYVWLGVEPWGVPPEQWPVFEPHMFDELAAICNGRNEHFVALNTMVWLGAGKGGNTHDTCVSAVACMVGRGWNDDSILERIVRAKREAAGRAGLPYDWTDAGPTIREWIESARAKGMDTPTAKPRKPPLERAISDWALERLGGLPNVATVDGILRSYQDGHWPGVEISSLLADMYAQEPMLRERDAKAGLTILQTLTTRRNFGRTPGMDVGTDDPRRRRICVLNGALDIVSGELLPWDSEHEILHQLPFGYVDDASSPVYDAVVRQTFDGDERAISLWDEYCAHTLIDNNSFQQMLFLRGPGGNGKGTLARMLRSMHDPNAVGSVGITDLNDERKRTSLVGKLVNISGEQSRLNLVSDTYLKKITGGDPIDVRRLYGETRNNVVLAVRFLELVNEMPATSDSSYALKRRIIILDCPNKVTEPDRDLDRKLQAERPGVLKRWVTALKRLYDRGHFEVPESARMSAEEYIRENSPVEVWLSEECEPALNGNEISAKELYAHFYDWSRQMNFRWHPTWIEWGRKLNSLGYPSKSKRIGQGVVRTRGLKIQDGKGPGL